jgi:hypothetical protein
MQAAALGDGRLVVVQPILATTIVFALPLGVWLSSQRITRRDVSFATALLLAGLSRVGALRAALLGTASGLLFGLVSALTKGAVEVFQDDGLEVLANWHLYALIVVGFAGMTITSRGGF